MRMLFLFFSCVTLVQPCNALAEASQPENRDTLALEVIQMSKSINDLSSTLKSQQKEIEEFQKLQSVISYLSFRSRSIEMMKYDLRFKKERRDGLEANISRIKEDPEAWNKIDKGFQSNSPVITSDQPSPSELRLKLFQDRLSETNSEIIALETEIQHLTEELATFESYVQERLGLLE